MSARAAFLGGLVAVGGCAMSIGRRPERAIKDLSDGRLTQVRVVEEQSGVRDVLMLSIPKRRRYLTGLVEGSVLGLNEDPVPRVLVEVRVDRTMNRPFDRRAQAEEGPPLFGETGELVRSDSNGLYRMPFKLPIEKGKVEVRGAIRYGGGYDQQCVEKESACVKPLDPERAFVLSFNESTGYLIFVEKPYAAFLGPVVPDKTGQTDEFHP